MAKKEPSSVAKRKTVAAKPQRPARSITIAEGGVYESHRFAEYMLALMTDVVRGAVTPDVCNASCNAGGKLLKMVELQLKYGPKGGAPLNLTGPRL